MTTSGDNHRTFAFDGFVLDTDRATLSRDGSDVKLRPKSFDLLRYLVEHHGRLVTKDELLDTIWANTAVTEDSIAQCVSEIRRAIDDRSQTMIRTVPRRGYIFELAVEEVGAERAASPAPPRRTGRFLLVAALVVAVSAAAIWLVPQYRDTPSGTEPIIAVLPFLDLSAGQDQQYLADGFAEEILDKLTKNPELRIIARHSSFSFRGTDVDIATVRETLGVSHVIEGSLRTAGERIRITAQLIDASTEEHVWSETYDRDRGDILAIQTDIAAAIADKFGIQPFGATDEPRPVNPRVYALTLRARSFLDQYDRDRLPEVQRMLEEALDISPDDVPALLELTRFYVHQRDVGLLPDDETERLFTETIKRAHELDPNNGSVYIFMGSTYIFKRSTPDAFRHALASAAPDFARAVVLEPGNPFVIKWAQDYAAVIRRYDVVEALGQYLQIHDPLCQRCLTRLADAYVATGQLAKAEEIMRTAAMLNFEFGDPELNLGLIKVLRGDPNAAIHELEKEPSELGRVFGMTLAWFDLGMTAEFEDGLARLQALRRLPENQQGGATYFLSIVYAWSGDRDAAFETLETAVQEMGWDLFRDAYRDPMFANLLDDRRWADLLEESGTSPEQLAAIDFDVPLPLPQH